MAQISWTKKSLKDLRAINDYISLDSEFYAARFVSKLIGRVDQLIEFPESGRIVPEKNEPEIQELIEGNYRIFYRLRKEKIIIQPQDITTVTQQIKAVWEKIQARDFYTGCYKEDCHWCNFVKDNRMAIALHDLPEAGEVEEI